MCRFLMTAGLPRDCNVLGMVGGGLRALASGDETVTSDAWLEACRPDHSPNRIIPVSYLSVMMVSLRYSLCLEPRLKSCMMDVD